MTPLQTLGVMVTVVALYFLLAGEISSAEGIAVLPVIGLSLVYVIALAKARAVPLAIGFRGILHVLQGIVGLLPELWRVGRALIRAVVRRPDGAVGAVTQVPFRFGALTAGDVGRRAAVVTAISLAPNGIALGMDHEADALLVHQLVVQPLGGDREWPG